MLVMLLRIYSALFSLVLGLFMSGVSLVILISGSKNYQFNMLPFWSQNTAVYGLLALGLTGVAAGLFGLIRKHRLLLLAFTIAAFALIVYGFFISPVYRFYAPSQAGSIAWLALAALCALIGSLAQFRGNSRA